MSDLSIHRLHQALEASWGQDTAYLDAYEDGNPALGNCYPTSRVVQHFFPDMDLVKGHVDTGKGIESHFWNSLTIGDDEYHVDLSWSQFPEGSVVADYEIRDVDTLDDSDATVQRVATLLGRVTQHLESGIPRTTV